MLQSEALCAGRWGRGRQGDVENARDGETLRVARLHAPRTLTARANRNRIVKVRTQLPGRGGEGGGEELQVLACSADRCVLYSAMTLAAHTCSASLTCCTERERRLCNLTMLC